MTKQNKINQRGMSNSIVETSKTDRKYSGWLWVLKLFGKRWFGWTDQTNPNPESWRVYYDAGYEPLEALKEDLTYA